MRVTSAGEREREGKVIESRGRTVKAKESNEERLDGLTMMSVTAINMILMTVNILNN